MSSGIREWGSVIRAAVLVITLASAASAQPAADLAQMRQAADSGNLAARVEIRKRADVSAGFTIVQDAGAGSCGSSCVITAIISPTPLLFAGARTFPLRYLSPQVKLSYKITEKLRWNAGYQYYGYREDFSNLQNYLAHTGYTSVSWSF